MVQLNSPFGGVVYIRLKDVRAIGNDYEGDVSYDGKIEKWRDLYLADLPRPIQILDNARNMEMLLDALKE